MSDEFTIDQTLIIATNQLASEVAHELKRQDLKIVFAESCTAGLVSALLAQTPGISQWLCGSAVTYRESVKREWLGVDPEALSKHTAVSSEVTREMAGAVLRNTADADLALAITGHLEPDATDAGPHVFIAIAGRLADEVRVYEPVQIVLQHGSRVARQWEAAQSSYRHTLTFLGR